MNTSGYVILEGNIGVGKSTFCRHLADAIRTEGGKEQRAEYIPEPDEKTNPFLADYYRDPAGHAFEMQCHMLHQRFAATQYAVAGARNGKGGVHPGSQLLRRRMLCTPQDVAGTGGGIRYPVPR